MGSVDEPPAEFVNAVRDAVEPYGHKLVDVKRYLHPLEWAFIIEGANGWRHGVRTKALGPGDAELVAWAWLEWYRVKSEHNSFGYIGDRPTITGGAPFT